MKEEMGIGDFGGNWKKPEFEEVLEEYEKEAEQLALSFAMEDAKEMLDACFGVQTEERWFPRKTRRRLDNCLKQHHGPITAVRKGGVVVTSSILVHKISRSKQTGQIADDSYQGCSFSSQEDAFSS